MKPCRFLACGLVALCCAVAHASADIPRNSVAVYYAFENAPSAALLDAVKDEVSAILAPAGLELEWRDLNHRQAGESSPDLVVVRFHGACATQPFLRKNFQEGGTPLATTVVSGGHVLPFSTVECDEIWNYIAPLAIHERDPQSKFAHAIGRVLAHELFHIFASTGKHSAHGVARAYHSREDLIREHFDFDDADTAILREYAHRTVIAELGAPAENYSSR